jgi:hypothetical protein
MSKILRVRVDSSAARRAGRTFRKLPVTAAPANRCEDGDQFAESRVAAVANLTYIQHYFVAAAIERFRDELVESRAFLAGPRNLHKRFCDIQNGNPVHLAHDYFRHEYSSSSNSQERSIAAHSIRNAAAKSRSFDCESALPRSGRKCKCSRLSAQDDNTSE